MRQLFSRTFVALAMLVVTSLAPRPAHAVENWVTKVVTFAEFSTASTTNTYTLYTTRANESISRVVMIRDVDFAGGSISAYTVSVGKSGAVTKYQSATDVFTGVSNGYTNAIITTGPGVEIAGVAIIATATSTSANLSAATAGRLTFKILVSNL